MNGLDPDSGFIYFCRNEIGSINIFKLNDYEKINCVFCPIYVCVSLFQR